MYKLISHVLLLSFLLTTGCITVLEKTEFAQRPLKTPDKLKTTRLRQLGNFPYLQESHIKNRLPLEIIKSKAEQDNHWNNKLAPFTDYDPVADYSLEIISDSQQIESTSYWPCIVTLYAYPRYYTDQVTVAVRLRDLKKGTSKLYFRQGLIKMKEGLFVPGYMDSNNIYTEYVLTLFDDMAAEMAKDIYGH